jgi:prepilin-type N-terminal cleavage/methylation domain-containing protein
MKQKKGFTLIEVMAAVIIIGIIAAIALPRFLNVRGDAEANSCKGNLASINVQIERYYLANKSWPTLGDLGTDYFPDGIPSCPDTGTYSIDTTTHRAKCSQHFPNGL